ncbi:acyl carrier protein [Exidia glandulosa HHB12029]|uniref:Acyl carrier protein n=1 Tax=Exidia glandulosa HHB12029 TaxID=1314781 RepID=A0A166B966_EXIGL|nr:acyl carrier protein [Exidia glandulosa HHB12029]
MRMRFAPYSAAAGLNASQIESRVLDVLKSFEKVDPGKLSTSASFSNDLGLDSLDAVEVVMAIEEEFGIEIPDAEADAISTVQQGTIRCRLHTPNHLTRFSFHCSDRIHQQDA